MRRIRKITAEEENFRIEPQDGLPGVGFIARDPVEPEPVGTLILCAYRVVGYDPDSDGSLMARLEAIDLDDLDDLGEIPDEYKGELRDVRQYAGISTHVGLYRYRVRRLSRRATRD